VGLLAGTLELVMDPRARLADRWDEKAGHAISRVVEKVELSPGVSVR
jgi:hypothetical protein